VARSFSKHPLSITHPELSKESYGWDPGIWKLGTEKVFWICKYGHKYEAQIVERKRGKNCPVCSGRKLLVGENDLATTHPEIAKEAFGWDPRNYLSGSDVKLEWKCEKGHRYFAQVWSRSGRGTGCPYCSGRKVIKGENDLATTNPDIANEAFEWDPSLISAGSQKKVKWKCGLGHIFEAKIANRTIHKTRCSYCSNNQVLAGFNDLATTHPEVASQANGWDPTTVFAGSGKILTWKCKFGHQWRNSPHQHLKSRTGCPICSNRRVLVGFNDLATTHSEIALQAYGWDPREVTAGHDKKKTWKCEKNHFYESAPYQRTGKQKSGCPVCDNKKIIPGFNDLASTHPDMAIEAFDWDPTTVSAGHNSKKKWICKLGHIWEVSPQNRFQKNQIISNCPVCSGDKVLKGFNDLGTRHPNLALEADGWDPSTIIAGHTKRNWKCSEGHTWSASAISRIVSKVGCPTCSKTGFDPNKKGYLYFLIHNNWEMFQIGITNFPEKRISSHKKLGWEIIEILGPIDGLLAQNWETSILRMLRAKGADLSNEKIAGKFDGYSEAWSKSTFQADSIKQLMEITESYEDNIANG
jgi:hypothetical protein